MTTLTEVIRSEASRRDTAFPPTFGAENTEAFALAGATQGARVPALAGDLMAVMLPHRRLTEDRVGGGFVVVEFIEDLFELVVASDRRTRP